MAKKLIVDGIEVTVTRKAIKHLYLRVTAPGGAVAVNAPRLYSDEEIISFVRSRIKWVRKQIERTTLAHDADNFPPASMQLWGAPAAVRIKSSDQGCAMKLDGGAVNIFVQAPFTQRIWETLRAGFLCRLVAAAAPPKIEQWRLKLGLAPVTLTVRTMKSRWGTCCPARRRVTLNGEIAAKHPSCLEHVIVHELLHFFEPNHGRAFKAAMDAWLPDWRETDRLLKQADH